MSDGQVHHERWMRRALDLARRGEGMTRPNPPVGAVVVRGSRAVGEGHHRRAGGPHAEIEALRQAGAKAEGGTLYVTLEPCSTWGRTPPCTDAILAAGLRTVVVSTLDPNPVHTGRGLRLLRKQGVRVVTGVCGEQGRYLVAPFAKWVTTGRPYVTLKLAMSLDGKIADRCGASKWITGGEARCLVHDLRRRVDSIVVGGGTVRRDDPVLLPRPSRGRRPWRVIVTRKGDIPGKAHVLSDPDALRTIVAVANSCSDGLVKRLAAKGVEVLKAPETRDGVSLAELLNQLGRRGLLHVLCEGGAELAASLVKRGLVDEFFFVIAPCILGGREGVGAVGGRGWRLGKGPRLRFVSWGQAGKDLVLRARPA
jgi:diaminohydroxyphosphoribosylaminopyrimidine deaminase / 5-amino-6-(5-phosphoribosylamino)uracil reductase